MSERDKFLTEAMSKCWHEGTSRCRKCHARYHLVPTHPDFSTWPGFGLLWEWAQKQEWWWNFSCKLLYSKESHDHLTKDDYDAVIYERYIHPSRFADALYEYLKHNLKEGRATSDN